MASSEPGEPAGDSGAPFETADPNAPGAIREQSPRPGAPRRPARGRIPFCILVACLCALPSLVLSLTTAVAPHILVPGGEISFQELNPRLPAPALLNWPSPLVQAVALLSGLTPIVRGVIAGCFLAVGLIALTAAANPSFRPITIRRDGSAGMQGTFVVSGGALGGWLAAAAAVAVIAVVIRAVAGPRWGVDFGWLAGGAMAGVLVGPAGAFGDPGQIARRGPIQRSAAAGSLAGLGAIFSLACAAPVRLGPLLVDYQMLGTFNLRYLRQVAFAWIAGGICAAAAIALLVVALLAPRTSLHARLLTLIAAVVCVGAGAVIRRPYTPNGLANRMDITASLRQTVLVPYSPAIPASGVPDGSAAGAVFAAAAHIGLGASAAQPNRSLLLFAGQARPVLSLRESGFTEDAVSASPASAAAALAFLRLRRFQTALSWEAVKHLYNVATIHFDDTSAMQALLLDLENSPHAAQDGATLRSMLFTCAATPANRALLDEWCSPRRFVTFDRFATRMFGDLYMRFGDTRRALRYYRAAGMPASFLSHTASVLPIFHQGEVSGRLLVNGTPVSGAQVGVIPVRLNGLPADLEPVVFGSLREVLAPYRNGLFPPYHPRPYALRWVVNSAVCGADGSFSISDLTEGEYVLICALPARYALSTPLDPRLQLAKPIGPMQFSYHHPTDVLGSIRLTLAPTHLQSGGSYGGN